MNVARAIRLTVPLILVALAGAAGAVRSGGDKQETAWTEVNWPFLLDEWGTGQAFLCGDGGCGIETRLFVRVKRGFCNCFQGIADDAEVDRLTDFVFLDGSSRPLGPGRAITVGAMAGRVRSFAVESAETLSRRAISLVVARNCDAVVATLISDGALAAGADATIADVLPRTILANLP